MDFLDAPMDFAAAAASFMPAETGAVVDKSPQNRRRSQQRETSAAMTKNVACWVEQTAEIVELSPTTFGGFSDDAKKGDGAANACKRYFAFGKRIPRDVKRFCGICRQHGQMNETRGHQCVFKDCDCSKCSLVKTRRQIMSEQIRIRRVQDKRFQRTTEPEQADLVPVFDAPMMPSDPIRLQPPISSVVVDEDAPKSLTCRQSFTADGSSPDQQLTALSLQRLPPNIEFGCAKEDGESAAAPTQQPPTQQLLSLCYFCQKCKNHNHLVYKKNHKQQCPYKECPCPLCDLIETRRRLDQRIKPRRKPSSAAVSYQQRQTQQEFDDDDDNNEDDDDEMATTPKRKRSDEEDGDSSSVTVDDGDESAATPTARFCDEKEQKTNWLHPLSETSTTEASVIRTTSSLVETTQKVSRKKKFAQKATFATNDEAGVSNIGDKRRRKTTTFNEQQKNAKAVARRTTTTAVVVANEESGVANEPPLSHTNTTQQTVFKQQQPLASHFSFPFPPMVADESGASPTSPPFVSPELLMLLLRQMLPVDVAAQLTDAQVIALFLDAISPPSSQKLAAFSFDLTAAAQQQSQQHKQRRLSAAAPACLPLTYQQTLQFARNNNNPQKSVHELSATTAFMLNNNNNKDDVVDVGSPLKKTCFCCALNGNANCATAVIHWRNASSFPTFHALQHPHPPPPYQTSPQTTPDSSLIPLSSHQQQHLFGTSPLLLRPNNNTSNSLLPASSAQLFSLATRFFGNNAVAVNNHNVSMASPPSTSSSSAATDDSVGSGGSGGATLPPSATASSTIMTFFPHIAASTPATKATPHMMMEHKHDNNTRNDMNALPPLHPAAVQTTNSALSFTDGFALHLAQQQQQQQQHLSSSSLNNNNHCSNNAHQKSLMKGGEKPMPISSSSSSFVASAKTGHNNNNNVFDASVASFLPRSLEEQLTSIWQMHHQLSSSSNGAAGGLL